MADRTLRVFVAYVGGKAAAMLFGIFATVLVGRLLGPQGLGRWTLLVAAGTLLHTALVNWTHASTVRYGREEWLVTHSLNRTLSARLPFLACSLGLALLLLALQPAGWGMRWFAAQPSDWWMVAAFTLSVWIAAEAQATLQATDRLVLQARLAAVVGALSVLALTMLLMFGRRSLGWSVVAFTGIPLVGWGSAWLYALVHSNTRPGSLVFDDIWRHLRFGLPVLPTFAFGYVSDWGDQLLLNRFSSVSQVGLFGIPYQFMVLAMTVNGVLTTVLLPRLIGQEFERPGSMRVYVQNEVPTLYGLWMIGAVWLVAALPIAVRLLTGPAFDESVGLLLVLLVVVPASVITSFYTVLFSVQERLGHVLLYVASMAITNVAISIVLIPTRGAMGAAIGTVVSYVVYQALYVWDQHRSLGVPSVRTWTLWATGLALGVAQLAAGSSVGLRIVWAVAATAVLAGAARAIGSVDGPLVDRLFAGRLDPIGGMIKRVLVATPHV